MPGCSCSTNEVFDGVSESYKRVLWLIIGLNAMMFVVEMGGSWLGRSQALQADALDFLGDSLTYTITLIAMGHSLRWRAAAAMIKGLSLLLMGLFVFGSTLYRVFVLQTPDAPIMGGIALAALAVNVSSALLLMRYRNGDANVRSVWLCSRNDAIGNIAVLLAAISVGTLQSGWPDVIVAALMAGLFLHSAGLILRQTIGEWRNGPAKASCG